MLKHCHALCRDLLTVLSDGHFHSGEKLGQQFNRSRAMIWKIVKQLRDLGLDIDIVRGRGYHLPVPIELLDRDRIAAEIDPAVKPYDARLDIFDSLESTNQFLLANPNKPSGTVCLAEQQTAGRGRHGRQWHSPFGHNVYCSLAWDFDAGPASLAGLSLVIGLAVIETLETFGLNDLKIKWPNDIWHQGAKLAGILIDCQGDAAGPCRAIIGIGLNRRLNGINAQDITYPITDLVSLKTLPPRNALIGRLIQTLYKTLPMFANTGLTPFLEKWTHYDALKNTRITAQTPQTTHQGTAIGVTPEGYLLIEKDGEQFSLPSAEIIV